MASTTFRFMLLSALVGLSATLVAVPITLGVHGGYTDHSSSELPRSFADTVPWLVAAVLGSSLITSLFDKLVSGFVALAALDGLAPRVGWLGRVLGTGRDPQ